MSYIGIIGMGVVGNTIKKAYNNLHEKTINIDINDNLEDLKNCKLIWVCVPETELIAVSKTLYNHDALFIIKSTCTPEILYTINFKNFVYSPEFLTENNRGYDFLNPVLFPIGTDNESHFMVVKKEYSFLGVDVTKVIQTTINEASLIKYYANTFLATKVIFNNEFKDLCDYSLVSWDRISDILKEDKRLGTSHWKVPGEHGRGYSGKCFPKDVKALILFPFMKLLRFIDELNEDIREH